MYVVFVRRFGLGNKKKYASKKKVFKNRKQWWQFPKCPTLITVLKKERERDVEIFPMKTCAIFGICRVCFHPWRPSSFDENSQKKRWILLLFQPKSYPFCNFTTLLLKYQNFRHCSLKQWKKQQKPRKFPFYFSLQRQTGKAKFTFPTSHRKFFAKQKKKKKKNVRVFDVRNIRRLARN